MTAGERSAIDVPFVRTGAGGSRDAVSRAIAIEQAIAIEINGLGYAVLMATPGDFDDLATGFLLAERVIDAAADIVAIESVEAPNGLLLRVILNGEHALRTADRMRHRATDSSCGLCGIENLEQALRPLPRVTAQSRATDADVFRALGAIAASQQLNRQTGAVHAAALCDALGAVRLIREDVGRHNAFDKLIGAVARQGLDWEGGFALLTSRCSYELVEKAVLAGCPMLVTISAATSLALDRAAEASLVLRTLARSDALLDTVDR